MHVTPSQLRAVRREGILSRFADFGPVAFAMAELPRGSAGTTLEEACIEPHWGLVLRGRLAVRGGAAYEPSSAFYVPGGRPEHRFEASPNTTLAGFAPLQRGRDLRDQALAAAGFEIVRVAPPAEPLPATVRPVEPRVTYLEARGGIEVEIARMGPWVFCRASFGALSGYATSWCDLPHWGVVLSGDLAIAWEDEVELLSAGDAYYCPPGPPGHRLEVADQAIIADYTPVREIHRGRRRADWRRFADVLDDVQPDDVTSEDRAPDDGLLDDAATAGAKATAP